MSVDGIGKKAPSAPPPADTLGRAERAPGERPFELGATSTATGAAREPSVAAAARTPLERLRAGDIDLDAYLDLKVDEATMHLSALSDRALHAIRSSLRDRLAGDPTLADLVRTATGRTPDLPRDE